MVDGRWGSTVARSDSSHRAGRPIWFFVLVLNYRDSLVFYSMETRSDTICFICLLDQDGRRSSGGFSGVSAFSDRLPLPPPHPTPPLRYTPTTRHWENPGSQGPESNTSIVLAPGPAAERHLVAVLEPCASDDRQFLLTVLRQLEKASVSSRGSVGPVIFLEETMMSS